MSHSVTILIVDDDEVNLEILEANLSSQGYRVIRARDGDEALLKIQNNDPDLVITDILMPNKDGYQLCRDLKSDDQRRHIPIIFYSATYTDPEDQAFALSLGAARFVVKPEDPDRFQKLIDEVLGNHRAGTLAAAAYESLDEETYLSRYNQRLIAKLEDKLEQLDHSNRRLKQEIVRAHEAEQMLSHLAHYDGLTGLPNRTQFLGTAEESFARARGERKSCAVVVLDIDNFRDINHSVGHSNGNQLLRLFAERLRSAHPSNETPLARVAGDEFATVLKGVCDRAEASRTAQQLLDCLDESFDLDGLPVEMTASAGISMFPEDGADADLLLRHAEVAMREARGARAVISLYTPKADPYEPERLRLLGTMRQAIRNGQFVLFFQPKIDLRTGRIVALEALVRWSHPTEGILGPQKFIGLAEQTGQIRALTSWVLQAALAEHTEWRRRGQVLDLCVNLSARNLLDEGLPEESSRSLLEQAGPVPPNLTLEITESAVLSDPPRARRILDRLSAMGMRVAIDDFGTGYSSLSHLKLLPVQELKIDKSFVISMLDSSSDGAIVRSTIDLAHNLGITATAEGVEKEDVLGLLVDLDCDMAQGFLMARPMPSADLQEWLHASRWGLGH